MTKAGPTTLDIAKATLLAPFGIDELATERIFGTILAHRADDADLFFQYNRSEGWTLEEGEVKSGSYSIHQGVGVRVVSGEKTAFAYADDTAARDGLDYWKRRAEKWSGNLLVAAGGLGGPLRDAQLEQEGSALQITISLSVEQTRIVLGYLRSMFPAQP